MNSTRIQSNIEKHDHPLVSTPISFINFGFSVGVSHRNDLLSHPFQIQGSQHVKTKHVKTKLLSFPHVIDFYFFKPE